MDREALALEAEGLGIPLSPVQLDQFEEFEAHLYEANETTNLTRIARPDCRLRHFVDSLLFQDLIPAGSSVLDIGTGPGFPAWPLACARPDLQVVAIDSAGKMVRFLAGNPLPNLKIVQVRAEEYGLREGFDVVTGRAVAPLGVQLELSAAFCRVAKVGESPARGVCIPMRTPSDRAEVTREVAGLGLQLIDLQERALPGTDVLRLFPVYRKFKRTPARFPRTWAEIKRKPFI